MLDPFFRKAIKDSQRSWRKIVSLAARKGIRAAFSTALAFYDSYRSERLPANLLQAQRDYFGAHTYERLDQPAASSSIPTGPEREDDRFEHLYRLGICDIRYND